MTHLYFGGGGQGPALVPHRGHPGFLITLVTWHLACDGGHPQPGPGEREILGLLAACDKVPASDRKPCQSAACTWFPGQEGLCVSHLLQETVAGPMSLAGAVALPLPELEISPELVGVILSSAHNRGCYLAVLMPRGCPACFLKQLAVQRSVCKEGVSLPSDSDKVTVPRPEMTGLTLGSPVSLTSDCSNRGFGSPTI